MNLFSESTIFIHKLHSMVVYSPSNSSGKICKGIIGKNSFYFTNEMYYHKKRCDCGKSGNSSVVERHLAKVDVAGSSPVSRSFFCPSTTERPFIIYLFFPLKWLSFGKSY
jgi:hypothetical protein